MGAMSRGTLRGALHLVARLGPAALLLWSGLAKAADRQTAVLAVDAYDVLPRALVTPVATVLPWVEMAVAALLLAGLFLPFAGAATAGLALVYLGAMGQAKARGLAIECGCFGGGGPGDGVSWWDILRDLPVLAAGLWIWRRPRGPLQVDRYLQEEEGGRPEAPPSLGG